MHAVSPGAASGRRAEANRANAGKSTGPRSPEGKRRSSANSSRHQLLASAATLLAEPNQERDALLARYAAELRPATAVEESLVCEIAVAAWRLRHLDRVELGVTAYQMQASHNVALELDAMRRFGARPWACQSCGAEPPPEAFPEPEPEPPELAEAGPDARTIALGAAWFANSHLFSLLLRYHAQARRDYYRALKELERVRAGEAGYLPPEAPPAPPRPFAPDPVPAKSETNPHAPAAKAAAGGSAAAKGETNPPAASRAAAGRVAEPSEKNQTNPTIPDFRLKWDPPDRPYIPTPDEFDRIIAGAKDDYSF